MINNKTTPVQLSHILFCLKLPPFATSPLPNWRSTRTCSGQKKALVCWWRHRPTRPWSKVQVPLSLSLSLSLSWWRIDLGPFGKRFLVTLFKYCENTCGWKSVMEIRVVVFKQQKQLFKQQYQTAWAYFISNSAKPRH